MLALLAALGALAACYARDMRAFGMVALLAGCTQEHTLDPDALFLECEVEDSLTLEVTGESTACAEALLMPAPIGRCPGWEDMFDPGMPDAEGVPILIDAQTDGAGLWIESSGGTIYYSRSAPREGAACGQCFSQGSVGAGPGPIEVWAAVPVQRGLSRIYVFGVSAPQRVAVCPDDRLFPLDP